MISEARAWRMVEEIARRFSVSSPNAKANRQELINLARNMLDQLAKGGHANPSLVVYGNPKAQAVGEPLRVHGKNHLIGTADELRYGWRGEWWKHPFDSEVIVLGILGPGGRREIVLVGAAGQPLWATEAELAKGEVVA